MGRLFLLRFDEGKTDYYMCKCCRTHIAIDEDLYQLYHHEQGQLCAFFYDAINLQVDEPMRHKRVGNSTIAEVFCVKCGEKLGWKYLEVSHGELNVKNDMVKLIVTKLVKRGTGDLIFEGLLMFGLISINAHNLPDVD